MNNHFENVKTSTEYHVMTSETAGSGSTVVSFGGQDLKPVPFVSMTLEKYTAGDYALGGMLNVTLDGVLYGDNFDETANELKDKIEDWAKLHKCFRNLNIKCDNVEIISSGIGYVKNYSFPQGPQKNWMNIIPYTLELAVNMNGGKAIVKADPYLKGKYDIKDGVGIRSISESVSWSANENTLQMFNPDPSKYGEYETHFTNEHIVVRYNLDVEGFGVCCSGEGNSGILGPLESAKEVVEYRLDNLQNLNAASFAQCDNLTGIIPSTYDTTVRYNHTRNYNVNELGGRLSVDGEYIIRPKGVNANTLMSMESSVDSSLDSGEKTITLTGSIKGLVANTVTSNDYGPKSSGDMGAVATAMNACEAELYNITTKGSGIAKELSIKNNLIKFTAAIGDTAGLSLKPLHDISDNSSNSWQPGDTDDDEFRILGKSYKRNYNDKSIDFTLSYSNKPRHKIPNALWAEISIDHELPARRIAEHVVPGRGYPVIQDLLCDTQDVFTINVTAQFEPNKNIHNIIAAAREEILILIYNTATTMGINGYIRTGDSENMANNGSYKRSIKLTGPSCNNATATNTVLDYFEMPGDSYSNAAGYNIGNKLITADDPIEDTPPPSVLEFDSSKDEPDET